MTSPFQDVTALVLDPNPVRQAVAINYLVRLGLKVDGCASPTEALARLKAGATPPRVILVDTLTLGMEPALKLIKDVSRSG